MKRALIKYSPFFVIALIAAAIMYYILERDKKIVDVWNRNAHTTDSLYATAEEKQMAQRFIDTTLPGLQQAGLIRSYTRKGFESIVAVDGKLWIERSPFFKQKFLEELTAYSKIHDSSFSVSIIDHHSGHVYEQFDRPEMTKIYVH